MRTWWLKCMIAAVLLGAFFETTSYGDEFFVRLDGDDGNDGRSMETAFATIQHGVDALEHGATLTIGPGEYFGFVQREHLGSLEEDTVIRADIPGTVLLRGDVPAPAFEPVEGYRFVYGTDFDQQAHAVNEVDTLTIFEPVSSLTDLEFMPGSMYYDEGQKRLYISTSDMQPPEKHHYTVSVIDNHGLFLHEPRRVIVEGIAATGFRKNGIMLGSPRRCVVRRCTAFLNRQGLVADSGVFSRYHINEKGVPVYRSRVREVDDTDEPGGNIIEQSKAYGNMSVNIVFYNSSDDMISDCVSFGSPGHGLRHYGGLRGPAVARNNLLWGNNVGMDIKGGGIVDGIQHGHGVGERNISLGGRINSVAHVSHNMFSRENRYNPDPGIDNIRYDLEAHDTRYQEFADPDNLDFRLQADSKFRGAGPDGSDRGPFQYEANIFYVKPDGDDAADGLSTERAWRTLAHGVENLNPGDTLYLEPGTYEGDLSLAAGAPDSELVYLRGRGTGDVVVKGALHLADTAGLTVERLNFTGTVHLRNSRDITFSNCRFKNIGADRVDGLEITHSEFRGSGRPALDMKGSSGVYLSGNIFNNDHDPAVRTDTIEAVKYADYNSYSDADRVWEVDDSTMSLDTLRPRHGRYSHILQPAFHEKEDEDVWAVENEHLFAAGGPHGMPLGTYQLFKGEKVHLSDPVVYSVTPTSADIEWWTSPRARCELAWGETPDGDNKIHVNTDGFGSFTLTGLEPETTYYVKITQAEALDGNTYLTVRTSESLLSPGTERHASSSPVSFSTPAVPDEPEEDVVYYVTPEGDDADDGLSRASAFETVQHAANQAAPGDTVEIAGGAYRETVRVRTSGLPDRPITFRAAAGEMVVFDGGSQLYRAFIVNGKNHILFDGFYFKDFLDSGLQTSGVFVLYKSNDIHVTRCFYNGSNVAYAPSFVYAMACERLVIRNCASLGVFYGSLYLVRCPDALIENNVLMRSRILQAVFVNEPEQIIRFKNNIVTDNQPTKVKTALIEASSVEALEMTDNCYYLRIPTEERNMIMLYNSKAYDRTVEAFGLRPLEPDRLPEELLQITLPEFQQRADDTTSFVRDPRFRGAEDIPRTDDEGEPVFIVDRFLMKQDPDFTDYFALDYKLKERKIGLQPEAFEDFHFNQ